MKNPIIAFVGPSKAGKTTLIKAALSLFPEQLVPIKSTTTRPWRELDDELFYDFTTHEDFELRKNQNKFLQASSYAGHFYGNEWTAIDTSLEQSIGVMALVEEGVTNFRNAGYRVIVIKVIPEHGYAVADQDRKHADNERAKQALTPDLVIKNSFTQGGLERAITELTLFLQSLLS